MWIVLLFIMSVDCRIGQQTITLSDNITSTITNYNTDFGTCMCDLNSQMCDMFCCCDSLCQAHSASWQAANVCSASSNINVECRRIEGGLDSSLFEQCFWPISQPELHIF